MMPPTSNLGVVRDAVRLSEKVGAILVCVFPITRNPTRINEELNHIRDLPEGYDVAV